MVKHLVHVQRAQMHNKRLIIASEPPAEAKFNTSFIKDMTGGTKINARECHSNETLM